MREAPFRQDRAASGDDAGDAVGGEMDVAEPHPGMDGEIVDALLGLLDQRVLVAFPVELDRIAVHLLQRLIDRHRADRHRRIADDPFARGVDVLAGGQVHHRVGAPADRPHHLLHLLLDRGGHGGVADIGVDLGEEVPADDHRLGFRVVDIGGDDGAAARHFSAHEFRRDEGGQRGAEALSVCEAGFSLLGRALASDILAMGDEDHLLGDDPGPRQFELRHGSAAARLDPGLAQRRQPALHVDRGVGVGVRPRRVIDPERLLPAQRDLAQRHAQIRMAVGRRIDFAAAGERPRRHLGLGHVFRAERLVHGDELLCARAKGDTGEADTSKSRPFAGMTRIRFEGSPRAPRARQRTLSPYPGAPLGTESV